MHSIAIIPTASQIVKPLDDLPRLWYNNCIPSDQAILQNNCCQNADDAKAVIRVYAMRRKISAFFAGWYSSWYPAAIWMILLPAHHPQVSLWKVLRQSQ